MEEAEEAPKPEMDHLETLLHKALQGEDVSEELGRLPSSLRYRVRDALEAYALFDDRPAEQPLPESETLADIQGLKRYEIVRELGRGGQGVVSLAVDLKLGRAVALKIIEVPPTGWHRGWERFRREAELMSRLDHPGICATYDAGVDGQKAWIAMRYVAGNTLAEILEATDPQSSTWAESFSGPVPDDPVLDTHPDESTRGTSRAELITCLGIFEKAARALHAAHEAGVVHRDIKPGNIIIADGSPVLLDFGLAGSLDGSLETLTRSGEMFGTPAFMSPEQVEGRRDHIDRRTDIYSLGATLYQALTFRRPFSSDAGRMALFGRILHGSCPAPSKLNPAIPRDLEAVVQKAMAPRANERYATALELAEDLERAAKGQPTVAHPLSTGERAWRYVRARPWAALSAATVILALGVVGLLFRALGDSEREMADAETRIEILHALERLRRSASASQPAAKDDVELIQKVVTDDATRALILRDPRSPTAWDAAVTAAAQFESRGAGSTRLLGPRAATTDATPRFTFETGLPVDRDWHLELWLVGPDGKEQRHHLLQTRGSAAGAFELPEGQSLQPGAWRWGVEVDPEHHPEEAAARDEHFGRFRRVDQSQRSAWLPRPTKDSVTNALLEAASLAAHDLANEALAVLGTIPTEQRASLEPTYSFIEARALALLGDHDGVEVARKRIEEHQQ